MDRMEQRSPWSGGLRGSHLPADLDEAGPAQLVMAVAHRVRESRLAALEPFGLALHQARAFTIIGRHSRSGEMRPSDLARELGISPRSATEVVDALEDKGLVRRSPSPTDRRAIVLSLTEDGRGLLGRMRHHPGPDDDDVFAGLEPAELAQLTGLLRRVVSANRQEP
jgi:DNA-binding MarR family transcriptional regulator